MTAKSRAVGDVIAAARQELRMLTGHEVDSVSAVRAEEDGWHITFEVVELKRVPESTSVLGTYETLADDDGAVIEFARSRRYYRNQPSEGDAP
ncbi:MAG TPA: gas vesicle protein GvpO [Acidimicrobiales bacterium]|jgi:hypothetical protein|nr:gas vesicle protein GvpO [Acidimicrobiales bacterium]